MSKLFRLLRAYQRLDPAARSALEIFLLYPGVKALAFHRVAHFLYRARVPFFPRAVSELARFLTGIEIHPGTRIGAALVIDHGMGVVIGETAIIGDHCLIYHGVTLGGKSLEKIKRHPTLGDRVIVGAGATILGNITVGSGARIGANAVVTHDVPENATVAGFH